MDPRLIVAASRRACRQKLSAKDLTAAIELTRQFTQVALSP